MPDKPKVVKNTDLKRKLKLVVTSGFARKISACQEEDKLVTSNRSLSSRWDRSTIEPIKGVALIKTVENDETK